MNRYISLSLLAFVLALITSAAGLLGVWTVTADAAERLTVLAVSMVTMLLLLLNSGLILAHTYKASNDRRYRTIAWLCLISMLLCIGGDIVNFNLPQTWHRHGGIVRHDYLADSVLFFAPGYALLLVATLMAPAVTGRFSTLQITAALLIASLAGGLSFMGMHLPGTGVYVSLATGLYSLLITAVGMGGLLLIAAYGYRQTPAVIWLVGLGLILAAAADGVIGQFWIYGNGGEGWFPAVRDVNWIIYVGSQALVVHLPLALLSSDDRAADQAA